MNFVRPAGFALATALVFAAAGCRTAGVGNVARPSPAPARTAKSAADLLAEHNRNADRIQSVEASSSVFGTNRRRVIPAAGGRLVLERPRNFRLILTATLSGTDVTDIGSNDKEFWLWFKDSPEKAVYFCNYDESGESPLPVGLQPDWIVEAMGLRLFSDSESEKIAVAQSPDARTWVLTEKRKTQRGERYFKETILSEPNHQVLEHRVFASDHKTLLARARVFGYDDHPIASETGGSDETVRLPRRVQLEMPQQNMSLDVTLREVRVNRFDSKRRSALFVEPEFKDFDRVDLAKLQGAPATPASDTPAPAGTTVRESLSPPPPRVRLDPPAPLGLDGSTRVVRDPARVAVDDLRPSYAREVEEVIGPPLPTAADPTPADLTGRSGWRNSFGPGIER
jgi:hypothetical protein